MSHSRSITPTPNPSIPTEATSTRPSFDLFASSREAHETDPADLSRQTRDSPHSPTTTAEVNPEASSSQSTLRARGEKRRRESEELPEGSAGRPRMSSPSGSSSNSQTDMADTELEGGRDERSERSPSTAPPPKKKRTRTLTTPHQSAVLHALLAQSRFPTTAMREEVGRQIGLSARKVQIWFQNQRQKAKRPRSQGAPPVSRPPQYGPFTNVPGSMPFSASSPGSFVAFGTSRSSQERLSPIDPGPSSASSAGSEQLSHRLSYTAEQSMIGLGTHLSGPGIPGSTFTSSTFTSPLSPTRGRESLIRHRRPSRLSQSLDSTPSFLQSGAEYPGSAASSIWAGAPSREHSFAMDPSLTLPPLTFDRPQTHGPLGTVGMSLRHHVSEQLPSSAPSTVTSFDFTRPAVSILESPFAHQLPDQPRPSLSLIPPPFALQPQPQWDPDTFSPLSRPGSSSIAPLTRPGTAYHSTEGRVSPRDTFAHPSLDVTGERQLAAGYEESSNGESTPQPPQRLSRFDPVRSSVFSYRASLEAPSTPPTRTPEREPAGDPPPE